jgi:predicted RND superfamily exporter protein
MKVDANWINDYSDSTPVKQNTLYADAVMGGVTGLTLLFDAGSPDAVKNPDVLAEITRIEDWANQQELVGKSYSLGGIVRDLNQTFNENDPDFYTIPESRNLIAQYMILYEGAGGTDAARLVSSDYQSTQLELRMHIGMTSETAALVEALEKELAREPLEATSVKITGVMGLWLRLLDYIVISQVRGFLIAFCAIGALLCLVFRSFRIGSISMLPNVLPALLALGLMGWVGIPLDYNKVGIAAVAMGIAVDDTVHLLSRFRHEFRRLGNYEAALRAALLDVGRALTITSITLVLGFLVLVGSMLASRADQGMLLAGTIVIALVADFLLMPALVLTLKPFGTETSEDANSSGAVSAWGSPG